MRHEVMSSVYLGCIQMNRDSEIWFFLGIVQDDPDDRNSWVLHRQAIQIGKHNSSCGLLFLDHFIDRCEICSPSSIDVDVGNHIVYIEVIGVLDLCVESGQGNLLGL